MIYVISFDVVSSFTSVSLFEDGKLIDCISDSRQSSHCEILVLLIEMIMAKNGINYKDCNIFSTTIGPGSFTGIKIAMSAIKSIELFSGACVSGIDRFDIFSFAMSKTLESVVSNYYVVLRSSEYFLLVAQFNNKNEKQKESIISIEDFSSSVDCNKIIVTDCQEFLEKKFLGKKLKIKNIDFSESYYCGLMAYEDFLKGKVNYPKERYMVPLKIKSKI